MFARSWGLMERLETRVLLTYVGIDSDFGENGYADDVDGSLLVAPLTGGKVLAVGRYKAVRLHDDGALDTSFIDRGAVGDLPGREAEAFTALVVGQQLFIAGIQREVDGPTLGAFVRKVNLSTGAASNGFGTDGVITFVPGNLPDIGNIAGPTSMMATADGGVIVAAGQIVDIGGGLFLHKFDADGNPDPAFGTDGFVKADELNYAHLDTGYLVPAGGGRFILLGGGVDEVTLKRFNADGSLDTTFGDQGVVALAGAPFNAAANVTFAQPLVQSDGKVVLALATSEWGATAFLVRVNIDGSRDSSFGSGGVVNLGKVQGYQAARDIALDSSGRIVGIGGETDFFRVLPDGSLDRTFDDDGFAHITRFTPSYYTNIALDASNRILIGGPREPARIGRFAERYGATVEDGSLLYVDGSDNADTIMVSRAGDNLVVTSNGESSQFPASDIVRIIVRAAGGDDLIDLQVDRPTVVIGGDGNDWIRTGAGADEIFGMSGADTIDAGAGGDVVFGGDGDDSLFGNAGNDRMFGEEGSDSLAGGDGRDKLFGSHPDVPPDADPGGADSLSGNASVDILYGGAGNDRVAGNGGHDRLYGGGGDDRIYGGTGDDWLYGGQGSDRLFGDSGPDHLYADDDQGPPGGDVLRGGKGNDILIARDAYIDRLYGDGGQDSATADEDDALISIEVIT